MAKNVENFKGYEYFKALYMQGQVSVYSQKLKNGKYGVLLTIQTDNLHRGFRHYLNSPGECSITAIVNFTSQY